MDSGASHKLTADLQNLTIHSEYDGTEEVHLADGSILPITHSGISNLQFPSREFKLMDTLCVPNASHNLIYVHQFTRANNVTIEFFPSYFL